MFRIGPKHQPIDRWPKTQNTKASGLLLVKLGIFTRPPIAVSPRESDREKRRGHGHAMAIMGRPRSNEGRPARCRVGARVGALVEAVRESNIAARL